MKRVLGELARWTGLSLFMAAVSTGMLVALAAELAIPALAIYAILAAVGVAPNPFN